MRIYVDGIFDLFHRGHVEMFQKMKAMGDDVTVIVGVISDDDAASYKRKTIINEVDRLYCVQSCRYVDETIVNAPLFVCEKFIDTYKIDLVVHSFVDKKDEKKQEEFFRVPKQLNRYKTLPYANGISTSDIIKRVVCLHNNKK